MSDTSPVQSIPLHQLILSPLNVRQVSASAAEHVELKASIRARGILQNLLVHRSPDDDTTYSVHGGGRRLQMLRELADEQAIAADHPVPCRVERLEIARETSLAENKARAAMHPADEFAAMAALIDGGATIDEIATRFGVGERHVRQRLRLGKLAPELLDRFRAGDITLEVVTAFTLSADHAAQRDVWEQVKDQHFVTAHSIRRRLTETTIDLDSDLGAFVGLAAYEAAGGHVIRDLFSEDEGGFMEDAALVRRLALEKLEAKAAELGREWGWAKAELDPEYGFTAQYDRVEPQPAEFSDAVNAELRVIEERQRELDALSEDEWDETLSAEAERIGIRYDTLIETSEAERRYLPEDRGRAGCLVTIGEDGEFEIYKGLVERAQGTDDDVENEDKDVECRDKPDAVAVLSPEQTVRKERGYSQSLIDDLKAHRQQITRAHLACDFGVAFDLALYTLCGDLLANRGQHGGVSLRASETYMRSSLNDLKKTAADRLLQARKQDLDTTWLALPSGEQFAALAALPIEEKERLFAWCVAATLEPQLGFEDRADSALELAGDRLAIPIAEYWRPTAANYWGRVKKAHALAVAGDVLGPRWAKDHADDKKATLAAALETAFDPATGAHAIGVDRTAQDKAAVWLPDGLAYCGGIDDGERDTLDIEMDEEEAFEVTIDDDDTAGDQDQDLPDFLTEEIALTV